MSGQTIATILSTVTALGLALERWTGFLGARRTAKIEPAQAVANAAATVASSVEALLTPLKVEVALLRQEAVELRAEVTALREVLAEHGIPIPRGPFLLVAEAADLE